MAIELVESFFANKDDCADFISRLKKLAVGSDSGECIGLLEKESQTRWKFSLQYIDGKYIGDYLSPFEPTDENVAALNRGCAELARRLRIYIDTNNSDAIPQSPPAFGHLSHPDGFTSSGGSQTPRPAISNVHLPHDRRRQFFTSASIGNDRDKYSNLNGQKSRSIESFGLTVQESGRVSRSTFVIGFLLGIGAFVILWFDARWSVWLSLLAAFAVWFFGGALISGVVRIVIGLRHQKGHE